MEKQVLYNVLKQIKNQETPTAAPNDQYLKALEIIGFVTLGWDNYLTAFGLSMYNSLDSKFNTW